MSIQTEIDRINASVAAAYSAAGSLGATMPTTLNVDNLADAVRSIPTGVSVCAYNLLDNSDFRNPVNQRGVASGDAVAAWSTFIDRWNACENGGVMSLTKDGLTSPCGIKQSLRSLEHLAGKKVTVACYFADGTLLVKSGTMVTADSWTEIISTGWGAPHMDFSADGSLWVFRIYNFTSALQWAALYEGEYTAETLPKYVPKGFGAELAECQRYYLPVAQNANQYITGHFPHSGLGSIIIPAPPMHTTPSIETFSGYVQVFKPGANGGWTNITAYIDTAIHSPRQGNAYQIVFDATGVGLTNGYSYLFRNIKALVADL